MFSHIHVNMCAHKYVQTHAYVLTCSCASSHTHMRAHMHTHIHTHAHTCTCAHTHIPSSPPPPHPPPTLHTRTHVHTHTHTHAKWMYIFHMETHILVKACIHLHIVWPIPFTIHCLLSPMHGISVGKEALFHSSTLQIRHRWPVHEVADRPVLYYELQRLLNW